MGIMSFLDDVTKALQDFGDSITSNLSGSVDNNIQETVHGTDTLGIINASHIESAISTSDIIGQSPLTGTVGQINIRYRGSIIVDGYCRTGVNTRYRGVYSYRYKFKKGRLIFL